MKKIGIIGAGAWGTALAQNLSSLGRDVTLWVREAETLSAINQKHENVPFLPGIKLNENIVATDSLHLTAQSDILLIVTPAQHTRSTLLSLKRDINEGQPLVLCSKGIEIETGHLMSRVAEEVLPGSPLAVLTGPTFAKEIARGLPGAVTIGTKDKELGKALVEALGSPRLRTYLTDDVVGAQIGGAVKNVIAIACGVIHGRSMGESARAALITRGLTEIGRLASAMGARKETLMGMCGIGDLILTCSSMQSRNFSLGVQIGEGKPLKDILDSRSAVTEGVSTAHALQVMARNHAVDMPISSAVNDCLNEGKSIQDTIEHVLKRPLRAENI
ncbi:MAG: NAD(P)-dependent glycerol-3-phosphate dehydrogenase [Rhodospirillales bacterium]|nr:NAD(P)-dependent glycerol-3-phosphate dehydrogenase [Alphaproteobacteria bacterium]USO03826.1 MAG: NAD(P)-dependent glycerol-3-phosphate dehydrogenase [Rhodospirillales bacterium]